MDGLEELSEERDAKDQDTLGASIPSQSLRDSTPTMPRIECSKQEKSGSTSPRLRSRFTDSDEVVLNVGGKHFQTRVGTLTKYSKFFQSLFQSDYITMRKGEPLFLDHDPRAFEIVLNWFRYQRLDSVIHFLSEPTRAAAKFCRKCVLPLQYEGKRINVQPHPKYGNPCWNHVCVGCGSTVAWSGACGTWEWTQSIGETDPLIVSLPQTSYVTEDIGASVKAQLCYFQVERFAFLDYPGGLLPLKYHKRPIRHTQTK